MSVSLDFSIWTMGCWDGCKTCAALCAERGCGWRPRARTGVFCTESWSWWPSLGHGRPSRPCGRPAARARLGCASLGPPSEGEPGGRRRRTEGLPVGCPTQTIGLQETFKDLEMVGDTGTVHGRLPVTEPNSLFGDHRVRDPPRLLLGEERPVGSAAGALPGAPGWVCVAALAVGWGLGSFRRLRLVPTA